MKSFARLKFVLEAHPGAEWDMEQNFDGCIIQVRYRGTHFRGVGFSEELAALDVLEKLEQGPGLVDAAPVFQT